MRVLHTADWHIGRFLMGQPRNEDVRAAVEEVVAMARAERPDLVVHAGDVFDGLRPAYDDLRWGVDALRELASVAPTIVLCGNHDAPALFSLLDRLLGPDSRLRFVAKPLPPDAGGVIEVPGPRDQVVRIAPIPFIHANRIVPLLEDPATWMTSYADRVDRVQQALAAGLTRGYDPGRHVLLLAAHLFVTGARFSTSERPLTVTDVYATHAERLPQVSYAAFGHVHRPQRLPGAVAGRYAGSVVQLDFGELDEQKEVVIVEAEPGRPARVETRPLSAGRPLRRLEGTLAEIQAVAPTVGRSLCTVVVRTESVMPDLSHRLAELLPDAVLLNVQEDSAATRVRVLTEADAAAGREPTFPELFREFVGVRGTRAGSADRVIRYFDELLAAVAQEEPGQLRDVDLLELPVEAD
ncbi:MAG TPA: exonuclease SbcCD subunit D [Candidatus Dormibacteraeota bacterium]|nr:exonuclease SbcCD subunit D [Candidatus Dormibacteraeota bacterium]